MTTWAIIYGLSCIYFVACLCLAAREPMTPPQKCYDGCFEGDAK